MPPDDDKGQGQGAFSQAQRDELMNIIGTSMNAMFTARSNTLGKQIHEKVVASMGETLTSKFEELSQRLAAVRPKDDDKDKDGEGKGGKRNKGEDVELATLKKQMAELAAKAERAEQESAQAKAANRATQLRDQTAGVLSSLGVVGERFTAAWPHIRERIRDDGENVTFIDETGTEVELASGVKGWAKTDFAKIFLPPTGTRGSGSRPGTYAPKGERVPREQALENVFSALDRKLGENGL